MVNTLFTQTQFSLVKVKLDVQTMDYKNIKVKRESCSSLMYLHLLWRMLSRSDLRICMTEMMEIMHSYKTCYMEG